MTILLLAATTTALFSSGIQAKARVQPGDPGGVTVLASSDKGITLALETAGFTTQPSHDDLGPCLQIEAPGYVPEGTVGTPRLPMQSTLVGIPHGVSVDLEIVSLSSEHWRPSARLCRVAPPEIPWVENQEDGFLTGRPSQNVETAAAAEIYTPAPASLTHVGVIRSQRVATVNFQPFQLDPDTGEIQYHRRIVVRLTFANASDRSATDAKSKDRSADPESSNTEPSTFEDLLHDLLVNYTEARAWRSTDPTINIAPTGLEHIAPMGLTDESPRYRIVLEDPGLYTITYTDLLAIDPTLAGAAIDTAQLRMSNQGQEIAIEILDDIDGIFGPGDTILFYGEAIDSKYTAENVYWLALDNVSPPPLRITTRDGAPDASLPISPHFTDTLHMEANDWYWVVKPTIGDDHWYWHYLSPGTPSVSHSFDLNDFASTSTTATLRGLIAGYKVDTQHSVNLVVNSYAVLTATWPAGTHYAFEAIFPATYLNEGANILSITSGAVSPKDYMLTNWFALDYGRYYVARDDHLAFNTEQGSWQYTVTGLTTAALDLLDLTNPRQPTRIINYDLADNGGTYSATFENTNTTHQNYWLASKTQRQSPIEIERVVLPNLQTTDIGADYIIISHPDFMTATQPLEDHHRLNGLRFVTVDVEDVYNVFNAGIVDPGGIRAFLAYAYANWAPPRPSYVLLVGDGNRDPLNYQGRGEPSFIPPYLVDVEPWKEETAVDNYYVSISSEDDALPDMHLGRLPVKSLSEAEAVIQKILDYAQSPVDADWHREVLFVADDYPDPAGNFYALSDAIADYYVPQPYTSTKIYYGNTHPLADVEGVREAITTAIDQGALIVNYIGHGARTFWANEQLLRRTEIAALNNAGKLPFIVPMTCLEGYYINPSSPTTDNSSVAETFIVQPQTGAIASWSPTSLGYATGHDYLHRGLFEAIFQRDIIELGPATTYAKFYLYDRTGTYYKDLLDTYLLFGDPATKLQVLPVDVQIEKAVAGGQTAFTAGDAITYTLTYTNAGPATARNVVISDTLPAGLLGTGWTESGAEVISRTGTTYAWDVADLPAGSGGVITITGTISEQHFGMLSNRAEIHTTTRELEDDQADNASEVTVDVARITTDVQITDLVATTLEAQQGDTDLVLRPGEALTYTLSFVNSLGPDDAREVVLTGTLPSLFVESSVVHAGAAITARPGSRFVWDVEDLAPGESGVITITGLIARTLYEGPMTYTVTISTSSADRFMDNNVATVTLMVVPERIYLPLVLRGDDG